MKLMMAVNCGAFPNKGWSSFEGDWVGSSQLDSLVHLLWARLDSRSAKFLTGPSICDEASRKLESGRLLKSLIEIH